MTATTAALHRAARVLTDRLATLERQLEQGAAEQLWRAYCETAQALAQVAAAMAPGAQGQLLTTNELAERLNVSANHVYRLKRKGKLTPARTLPGSRTLRWNAEAGR